MDLIESVDIILMIIVLLPILDIRNLLRCSKKLYLLRLNKNILLIIDVDSLIWENKLNSELLQLKSFLIFNFSNIHDIVHDNPHPRNKYILEIFWYGYIHLLPTRYIFINDAYGYYYYYNIYINAGKNNFLDLIKFMIDYNFPLEAMILGASLSGNIKILKILLSKKRHLYNLYLSDAVRMQQLQILKWAKKNGFYISIWTFQYAIENKHLEILKWAYKNNYVSKNIYKQAILNN